MSKFQEDYKNYLYHSGFITEDELIHYGVPGMRWGVRRARFSNWASNAASRIGQRARNMRLAASIQARAARGSLSGAGARIRDVASRAASRIGSKARSLGTAAGMAGRSAFSGAGARVRDRVSRFASRAGSKIRNIATVYSRKSPSAGLRAQEFISRLRRRRSSGNPGTALMVRR